MSEFSVNNLNQSSIQYIYSMRGAIWFNPPYQREGDIWPLEKRQLLVDSILNGFDIPKLYFHELLPARKDGKTLQKFAIIDGKQRLAALWDFIDGKFALSTENEYLYDDKIKLAGLTYVEIAEKYPLLKSRFDATSLPIVAIRTDDIELIEDMFSRLNEAVPLNAPEKRNAKGGPLPKAIRELADHPFFTSKVPFSDKRYKHRDLAAKFLLIEERDVVTDTKKAYLDNFVISWKNEGKTDGDAKALRKSVEKHLSKMANVFVDGDELLGSIGMTLLIFHYFRLLVKVGKSNTVRREHFLNFEAARRENRDVAEQNLAKANYDLLEFDKYVQTPNDAYATRLRLSIVVKFMREDAGVNLPKAHEYFDTEP